MRNFTLICAAATSALIVSTANAGPIDGRFNYQGRLTSAGVPVTGLVDVRFSLWDADVAGVQKGPTIDVLGESITDGLFNAELDFGVAALDGDMRWLQIEVRSPAGVGGYSTLGRQEILGTPYAIQTRGIFVDDALNVGIGTTSPAGLFQVKNPTDAQSLLYTPGALYDLSLTSPSGAVVFGNVPSNTGENSQLQFRDGIGGSLNAVIGAAQAAGDGFLNIHGENGAFNFQVRGNPDFTADGVSNTRMFIRSSGTGGVGGEVSVLNNDGDETIELLGGASGSAGTLSMFDPTTGASTVSLRGDQVGSGGKISTFSEDGFRQFDVEPDFDGEGAFVTMRRTNSSTGFTFDGNDFGTGDAQLTISGASRSVNIQTRLPGNSSVALPTDAISRFEILDEPGVASSAEGISQFTFTGPTETILSRTITVPASGWCFVIGTGQANASHTTGTSSQCFFGVSDTAGSFPVNQDVAFEIPIGYPSGFHSSPVTVQGLFSVTAGANTFYFLGEEFQGSWTMFDMQLSVMYFPTAYGTVTPSILARGSDNDALAPPMPAMTPDDIYAEQMQAAAFDQDRRDAEAADYAQKFAELEAQLQAVLREQASLRQELRRAGPPMDESQSGAVLGHSASNSR